MERMSDFELFMRMSNLETAVAAIAKRIGISDALHTGMAELRERLKDVPQLTDESFALLSLLASGSEDSPGLTDWLPQPPGPHET